MSEQGSDSAGPRITRFTDGGGRTWEIPAERLAGLSEEEAERTTAEIMRTTPPTRLEEPVAGSSWSEAPASISEDLRSVNARIMADTGLSPSSGRQALEGQHPPEESPIQTLRRSIIPNVVSDEILEILLVNASDRVRGEAGTSIRGDVGEILPQWRGRVVELARQMLIGQGNLTGTPSAANYSAAASIVQVYDDWARRRDVLSEAATLFRSRHLGPGYSLDDDSVERLLSRAVAQVGIQNSAETLASVAARLLGESLWLAGSPPAAPAPEDPVERWWHNDPRQLGNYPGHPTWRVSNPATSLWTYGPSALAGNVWRMNQPQQEKETSVTEIASADESLYYYTTDTSSWPADAVGLPTASAAYFEAIRALKLRPGHRVVTGRRAKMKPEDVIQKPYDSGAYIYNYARSSGRAMPGGRNYLSRSPSAEVIRELGEAVNLATLAWMEKHGLNPDFSTITDQMTYTVDAYDVEIANGKLTGVGA